MNNNREQQLAVWATAAVNQIDPAAVVNAKLQSVSGDASFRRYFRVNTSSGTYIAVDAPPANENSEVFVRLAQLFRSAGVAAPEVHAVDYAAGFLLLQDFGDELYLGKLLKAQENSDQRTPDRLYGLAIDALLAIQTRVDKKRLDPYDRAKLHNEMALFEHWFCGKFLEIDLSEDDRKLIADTFMLLEDAALAQPQVAVHRDYHSRNLMVQAAAKSGADIGPGIIDFQDAVTGAYTYDLVSLLRDCYIRWDQDQVQQWALHYFNLAQAKGVVNGISERQFSRDFDLMGLQRNLKVMGIFSRLCIRDTKPQYLADIPLVMRYFLEVGGRYRELTAFMDWFRITVMPVAQTKLKLDT